MIPVCRCDILAEQMCFTDKDDARTTIKIEDKLCLVKWWQYSYHFRYDLQDIQKRKNVLLL